MRNIFLAYLILSSLGCKPRSDSSGLRDVQLTSLSERIDYVVFKDDNDIVQLHSCPRDAVPGQNIENVVIPPGCRNMDASTLSRFQCRNPAGAEPVPYNDYKQRLLEIMNLQSMEGSIKDIDAQKRELRRMESDLAKLDKIVAKNPTPPLTEEAEKARGSVESLKNSIPALEAEVNRNKAQLETYNSIIASLDCSSSAQYFKGESEFTQILQPFQSPEGDITIEQTVNQYLIEGKEYAHSFETEISNQGTVGAVSIQIDLEHDYPEQVGIRLTSPDGKSAQFGYLIVTSTRRQLQLGLINNSYNSELVKLTGAKIKGKWKIEYGDRGHFSGTVKKITIKLHKISFTAGHHIESYRIPLSAYKVPSESIATFPIFIGLSQLISDFSLGFSADSAIGASLTAPNGKLLTFTPDQDGYKLDQAALKTILNTNAAGVWLLSLHNPGNTPTTVTPKGNAAVINTKPPQTTGSGNQGTTSGNSSGTGGSGSSNQKPSTGAVSRQDVDSAIARNRSQFASYNKDTGAVDGCKSAGASAGWTQTMQEYYCTFPISNPEIRTCFTGSVRGAGNFQKKSYPDAYDFCATTYNGTPMKWVRDTQDAVFRAVMIDKKF